MHFITGIQFCHVDSDEKSEILGDIDLHDYGNWKEHRMEEGDQIIGIYGLQNNLIRGIGFILMNMKQVSCSVSSYFGSATHNEMFFLC